MQEPVGSEVEDDARSTSKSAVSRMFVDRTRQQLCRLMNRPLSDLRLAVMMLDGIDLHARRGETLAVLGRSGTGKSVLLKVLIGLQPPDAGSVRIAGHCTTP